MRKHPLVHHRLCCHPDAPFDSITGSMVRRWEGCPDRGAEVFVASESVAAVLGPAQYAAPACKTINLVDMCDVLATEHNAG